VEELLRRFMNVSRTDKITDLFFEIKNIMFGSVKISFLHFMLSWIMFDYFSITNFNFILSLFLGFMALVPIYHPFIGALFVFFCSWMYKPESSSIFLIILCLVYLFLSNLIFNITYSKISMPSLVTNLSVILGIYSFGILGVVYGPIIVTILRGILSEIKSF
jgi:predicted PurR-regulated permease PerM